MESNFENRLSFLEESRFFFIIMFGEKSSTSEKRAVFQHGSPGKPFSKKRLETALFFSREHHFITKMELHGELSYGQPNGSPRRAILALFLSQCRVCNHQNGHKQMHKLYVLKYFSLPYSSHCGIASHAYAAFNPRYAENPALIGSLCFNHGQSVNGLYPAIDSCILHDMAHIS